MESGFPSSITHKPLQYQHRDVKLICAVVFGIISVLLIFGLIGAYRVRRRKRQKSRDVSVRQDLRNIAAVMCRASRVLREALVILGIVKLKEVPMVAVEESEA